MKNIVNIRPELTVEQAGLVIHAIDQLLAGHNTGGLYQHEVENLARVAHGVLHTT
jgi:hypothetical protein